MADERFTALSNDPRYRLPNRKEARTKVDPRFKTLFKDPEFQKKASVDRYGRKVQPGTGRKDLEKLYRLDKHKESASVERDVVRSSEEEGEDDVEDLLAGQSGPQDGLSQPSSEEDSSSDEKSGEEAELAEETAGQEQTEDIPMGEVSRRIAAVNLDWDNIRATDVMAVAASFAPSGGRIECVTVYPSEFGRERLEQEELDGPPREIFASSNRKADDESDSAEDSRAEEDKDLDEDEDDEKIKRQLIQAQASEGDEFDTAKLRQYQLERLRYFYAVIECDTKSTAKALYDSMDGREYLSTANFFDLRFIPDETSFEGDKLRDQCTKLPEAYKPNEFRTEALTHSKVRLTWDDDDTTRKQVQKRAFSRAEMDENDLKAYIGSESSDAESIASRRSAAEDRKAKKREAQRSKMRGMLGLGDEVAKPSKKDREEPVGDMQITFASALAGGEDDKTVFENEPQDEESTRARYVRKERERKQKRKEKMKAARSDGRPAEEGGQEEAVDSEGGADEGFADPFFDDPAAATAAERKIKKAARLKKRSEKEAADVEAATRRDELELLMAEDQADDVRHFDMREVQKAEKAAKRKNKKPKNLDEATQDPSSVAFKIETEDPRFNALFDSHEYAIDPTNPRFKGTDGMKALLAEGRKKRRHDDDDGAGTTLSKKVAKSR